MNITRYKEEIKNIIEATNDEALLRQWKMQLERDVDQQQTALLSTDEWQMVQQGLEDYKSGHVLSLEAFIAKR